MHLPHAPSRSVPQRAGQLHQVDLSGVVPVEDEKEHVRLDPRHPPTVLGVVIPGPTSKGEAWRERRDKT